MTVKLTLEVKLGACEADIYVKLPYASREVSSV